VLENKHIKRAISLIGIYILAGVILFPWWYLNILQWGGISELIYVAQSRYLVWNIIAVLIIGMTVLTMSFVENNHNEKYQSLIKHTKGITFISLVWVFIAIAGFRLLTVSLNDKRHDIQILADKVQILEEKQKLSLAISSPIETIYIYKEKIESLYSQISPKLQLSERSVGSKKLGSTEAEVGIDGVASFSGKLEQSKENSDKYKTRKASISEKLISTVNYLNSNKELTKVLPIKIESEDISRIDDALAVLTSYEIDVDTIKVNNTKKTIESKLIRNKVSEVYKVNSWILISGPVAIATSKDKTNISIKFEYVSDNSSSINFVCDIPTSKIDKQELGILQSETSWDLNVFGKVIRKDDNDSIKYSVQCLSLYR